jgi:hypothetical protein
MNRMAVFSLPRTAKLRRKKLAALPAVIQLTGRSVKVRHELNNATLMCPKSLNCKP